MPEFCHTFHTSMKTDSTADARGMPGFQRTASGPRTGRGPRQETRIRLLTAMVAAKEADAKGRGSRWGVTSRRQKSHICQQKADMGHGICGPPANRRQIWATGYVGHQPTEGRYGPGDMWAT